MVEGSNAGRGEMFRNRLHGPGAPPPSCTMDTGSLDRVKRPGLVVDRLLPSGTEVKTRTFT